MNSVIEIMSIKDLQSLVSLLGLSFSLLREQLLKLIFFLLVHPLIFLSEVRGYIV